MMTSFAENIPAILKAVVELNPKSVLDIGAGFGKYGILVREALLSIRAEQGELCPEDDLIIDAIEYSDYFYKKPAFDAIYGRCIKRDMFEYDPEFSSYDLTLMIDVVEHWPKDQIKFFLDRFHSPLLISTPKDVCFYELEYYGCAKHVSQWDRSDFRNIVKDYSTENSHIFLINNAIK